ncbi:MAG TPA: carboxypeptidase regulatory-like domain-containing protein [Verrucomicrobiae bacterium]|nr:carboxypeptidase regulatory-like domain-containing protein [Verrucomicrobiae bacterium]
MISFLRATACAYALLFLFALHTPAQSLVTGNIIGTVTDPSGAVVANTAVELRNTETGEKQNGVTNGEGVYQFTLLKPAVYEVDVALKGLSKIETCSVAVGQTTKLNLNLQITIAVESVTVSGMAPIVSTEPGIVTTFTPAEVQLLPSPGQDITTIAFTAPGVVVADGSGKGNFSVNGLPGTSNLITINGENDMDPYFNVNSSGASNLTLGLNEMQEVSVITNPYSGQYGQLSGAQVTYVTKSGTNQFHGNAQWWWNGDNLNSNDFFANATDTPRPFSNANQWAASLGGPIIKDHTWFFVDTEGLSFVLPNVFTSTIPTPGFSAAVLNNVQTLQPGEASAYQAMLNVYSNAAKGKVADVLPADSECSIVALPGWNTGSSCAENIVTTPSSQANEWIIAGRVDQKLTSHDDLFGRFKIDHGTQPTVIDPLNSAFDAISNQPLWDVQAQERHVFSSNMTNLFTAALSHYTTLFSQNVAAWQSVFPEGATYFTTPTAYTPVNFNAINYPQGRKVTQYQFIDDFTWLHGNHSLKFGFNFRRYDVSDRNFYDTYPLSLFGDLTSGAGTPGLQAFADGVANSYIQQDNISTDVPIALWGLGIYGEDQWKLSRNFTLMGALRFEHNSNPVCQHNCFSNFKGPFPTLPSVVAGPNQGDVPYSADLNSNLHQAYMSVDAVNVSPRIAFSWAPDRSSYFPWFPGDGKTVVSGGLGIFFDNPATGLVDQLLTNPPGAVLFYITPVGPDFGTTGILPFDKTSGGPAAFAAASAAFSINKSYNELSNELFPIIGFFPTPGINSMQGTIHSPQVQEWNLKVDQQIGSSTAVSVNYVGNHSLHIPYSNSWWNAYASGPVFASVPGINSAPADFNYFTVTTVQSGAVANYNGVTFSVREQYHSWFLAHVNYTYSHTLDELSNGGIFPFGANSLQFQINPGSLRANNYGNADYDVRNLFNADYVITPPTHFERKWLSGVLGGWQWSGKVYVRSGLPFTVLDGNASSSIQQGATSVIAQQISIGASAPCGKGSVYTNGAANFGATSCLNANAFVNTAASTFTGYTSYPTQTRNQFRGPDYINFDMSLFKTFSIKEKVALGIGANAYNVFNHPNFALPDNILGDSTFGQLYSMQNTPTSPYGSGLGFHSGVRVLQLSIKLSF